MSAPSKRIYIKLFGGEQDGFESVIKTEDGKWPEMFYVHRGIDDARIKESKKIDAELHAMLSDALSILAYEFHSADPKDGVPGSRQYRYDRCEMADKALSDPAC